MEVQGHAELPRNTSAVQPASSHSELAPYYPVPACRLVSVEHPFDIRNVARAIESLGGSKGVGKVGYRLEGFAWMSKAVDVR